MSVIVLDAGNSIIKAKIARREQGEVAFPHAKKALTDSDYNNILTRSGSMGVTADYIRVNGKPYAIGESAERHGVQVQRTGASRYTREYYGIFAAAVKTLAGKLVQIVHITHPAALNCGAYFLTKNFVEVQGWDFWRFDT